MTPAPGESGDAYWFVIREGKLLIHQGENGAAIPKARSAEELSVPVLSTQYLGTFQGLPCFSAQAAAVGPDFVELRAVYSLLGEDVFLLGGKAAQIVRWEETNRFCGRCGTPTGDLPGERAKRCPKCGHISYPRLSPAVITAVLKGDDILLAHGNGFSGNIYSLIAGFVEPGESLEEAVRREIMEETGLTVKHIRYTGSQPWPFPDSLMFGFTAEYAGGEIRVDKTELADAQWFNCRNLPQLPMPMSIARKIIDRYIKRHGGAK